jgi:hypothetical protein
VIRFIIRRREHDFNIDLKTERFYTIDADVPELESALQRGGFGEMGYESHDFVGVEVIDRARQSGEEGKS